MADQSLSRRFIVRIVATGGLLVGGLLVIAAISLWGSYTVDKKAAHNAMQTSAQLLEQALTRSFESTDVALTTLSNQITDHAQGTSFSGRDLIPSDPNFTASINSLLRFAPHIRQFVIIDDRGEVLLDTSHRPGDSLKLSALGFDKNGPHAVGGGLLLGAPVRGRFLGDPEDQRTLSQLSVLPVILPFRANSNTVLYAVAALNSGFFRDAFDAVVASDRAGSADQVLLARYDGVVLVQHDAAAPSTAAATPSTEAGALAPPALLPNALARALTSADGGSVETTMPHFQGSNGQSEQGSVHWRVSSRYPIAVLIATRDSTVWTRWLQGQRDILIGVPIALTALVLLIWGLLRQVLARSILQDRVRVLSQAIEQGPTTVIITDDHGKIEYVNRAFKTITGFTSEDVLGQTPAVIKSGLMRDDVYDDLWSTITQGNIWQGDLLNRTKDGRPLWMTAAISGVRGEDDTISHYVAVQTDVTERRVLDERLAETQRMTDGLLRLPVILYRINKDGIIIDAAGQGLSHLNLGASALIGRRYNALFPDIDAAFAKALVGETARADGRARFGHKDAWLEHVLAPNPRDDDADRARLIPQSPEDKDGVIGFALDVTARHNAEENLSATVDRLNASNRELEQFAYVASHDLQEPLRIVASYLSLLKRRYSGKLGEDADTFINYAVDGAHRMQSLILDLLQLSRIGSQGQDLEPVQLRIVVNQAIANLEMAISDTSAIVRTGDLPEVMGDKAQLLRLFQNLIANALKYRHPDRCPEITIDACLEGGMWHIVLEDNGQGIEKPFREKVFLIFQRLHTREQAEGNGIGLAICRKIAERHGGAIWIDGDPNLGTRFHITLRRSPPSKG
jgi:PAS domain S-box-containing protein